VFIGISFKVHQVAGTRVCWGQSTFLALISYVLVTGIVCEFETVGVLDIAPTMDVFVDGTFSFDDDIGMVWEDVLVCLSSKNI